MNKVLLIRSSTTIGVQLLRLTAFLLLLRGLAPADFEYFFAQLSLLSMVVVFTAGLPLYLKTLFLDDAISKKSLVSMLTACLLLTAGICSAYASTFNQDVLFLGYFLTILFLCRIAAGYFDILMDVSHKYQWSLAVSFAVEMLFFLGALNVTSWMSWFSGLGLEGILQQAGLLSVLFGFAVMARQLNKHRVLLSNYTKLLQFSAIECGSIIAFGLDIYFASKFLDTPMFVLYIVMVRLFSPIGQFQGLSTRFLWSAGFNKNIGKEAIDKQSLLVTWFCIGVMLVILLIAPTLLRLLGTEVEIWQAPYMLGVVVLTYLLILYQRHYKNRLNSRAITYTVWKFYFPLSVVLLICNFSMLWIFEVTNSNVYVTVRFIFFLLVTLFFQNLLKRNNEKFNNQATT